MRTSPRSLPRAGVERTARYADMFAALGTDCRLRILRLLLAAHPDGLVVGDVQSELGIPPSTLSHHLERLRAEGLVEVRREGTFLHYSANTETLEELLGFLLSECCSGSQAVNGAALVKLCDITPRRRTSKE